MSENKNFVQWLDVVPLASGETRVVELGNTNSGFPFAETIDLSFITFGIVSSHTLDFRIQGCYNAAFTVIDDCFTHSVPANTYQSPYDMASPFNTNGWLVLNRPYTRIQLTDTATANHTYTRLFVRAWE